MFYKLLFVILFLSISSNCSNIDKRISENKTSLKKENKNKKETSKEIKKLAIEIIEEENKFSSIEKKN